jgi:hypothetical protein
LSSVMIRLAGWTGLQRLLQCMMVIIRHQLRPGQKQLTK